MIGTILVMLVLSASPVAHAETRYCNGTLTSNGVCIGGESNMAPTIIRCDYPDGSNCDPRCVGIGERRPAFDPPLPKSRAPR
jgi:hypothetical protein